MTVHRKHKGARNELAACVWLMDQGYEVFRNVSYFGDVDLVAIKGDELIRLDVKTQGGRLRDSQFLKKIRSLHIMRDGTFQFDIHPDRDLLTVECKNCLVAFQGTRNHRFCCIRCSHEFGTKKKKKDR